MVRQIIGSKGGGGGSSFVTKPDTLRSNDSFELLLGLGSGRWKGLVNGLKSLKINGVPMENEDGTSNFQDIYAIFADGNPLQDQMVTFKLGGGASSDAVGTQLSNPNTSGPGPWISGAASVVGPNFIDLRFVVQQLYLQDTKGIRENTANIEIEMRPSGSPTWVNPFAAPLSNTLTYDQNGFDYNDPEFLGALYTAYLGRGMFNSSGIGFRGSNSMYIPITGKTSSAYVKELRIAVPNTGTYANKTWQVRARLIEKDTVDDGDNQQRRIIAFESIAGVNNAPVGDHPDWDGLVWMQIHGKASDQFSGFPEIVGEFDTKICKVPPPAVFNPTTRAYTAATWAGDYEEHFTTDPAWQIKEFVEDPIHGIAGIQPGSTVDKWDCLEASKYYSELVPDGKGGTHPRFNMNLTITEARDIDEMMSYLSGAVNSYMEDVGDGVWRLKVDKPETPVMLFTPDNIFGDFNYSHTDVDTRFNDWRGTFIDEELGYETNTARVFDQDDIDLNGIKFTEVALVGCTNHQEALRRLMFRMRVSLNEYKLVSFQTNKVARYLSPLNTILVADASLNTDEFAKSTSRVANYASTTVNLMRPIRLEIGVAYQLHFTTVDKKTVTRNVTNGPGARGDVTVITIDSPLPVNIMPESAVALQAVGLPANPLTYRVIGIERSEDDEDNYTVVASIIDSGKWNAMDNVSADELAAQEAEVSIDPPTAPLGGMFDTLEYSTEFALKKVLQVNWNRPGGKYLQGYRVEYSLNNGPFKILAPELKDSIVEFENPEDGSYTFRIIALDRRGVESTPLIGQFDLDGSQEFRPPTHLRGTLVERPATAPYDGFRYTVTNADPPVTQVWDSGVWVDETNLVTEGSQIGVENGATVGMTAAEAIAFEDLVTTYGSTASAAASAAAAAASVVAAELAKVAAEAASADAAADEALAAASAAAAGLSATSASGSATTATGQATIATTQASAAATSASVSAGHASTASTQAGIATTQAASATASASTATTQATLSATYAGDAALRVAQSLPSDFNQDGLYWSDTYTGDPAAATSIGPARPTSGQGYWTFTTEAGVGRVAQATFVASPSKDAIPKARLLLIAGRKYRATARVRQSTAFTSGSGRLDMLAIALNSSYGYVSNITSTHIITGTWTTFTFEFTADAVIALGGVYFVMDYRVRTSGGGNDATGAVQVAFGKLEDITESDAAAASATIASTQATTATAAGATATTQAGLAATHAGTAAGHAGTASTQAGIATTQATSATTSAATATSQATLAASSATAAAGSATTATTQAGIATAQAATATSQAAITTSNVVLTASFAQNSLNRNPVFLDWPGGTGTIPAGWGNWESGTSSTRVAGDLGGYAYLGANSAGNNQGIFCNPEGMSGIKSTGYFVVEADVTLVSGVMNSAGFYITNSSNTFTQHFADYIDPATGAAIGAGVVGRRYRISKLYNFTTPNTVWILYLMTGWSSFGTVQAKSLKWHRLSVREATPAEIRDQTVLGPMEATVSTHTSAIADAATKLAEARLRIKVAASGGNPAILEMYAATGATSYLRLGADQIHFGDNTIFYDATDVLETVIAGTSVNSIAWGAPFGASSDLLQWYGPTGIALASRTKANAYFYISTTVPRIGGSALTSGVSADTVGYGGVIKKLLNNGDGAAFTGGVGVNAGGANGTIAARIEVSEAGLNSWSTVATGATESVGPGEAGSSTVSGTFTNSSGSTKLYDFRIIEVRVGGTAGGTINNAQTYLTG